MRIISCYTLKDFTRSLILETSLHLY